MNLHAPKGIDVENWFIECYRKYKGHPMWILLGLYKGNYNKFFMAVVFFFIKHCPVWVLPIITANIINDITSGAPDAYQHIFIEAIIMVVLIALNIPTNYMYTRYKSLATFRIIKKRSRGGCSRKSCVTWKPWKRFQRRCF